MQDLLGRVEVMENALYAARLLLADRDARITELETRAEDAALSTWKITYSLRMPSFFFRCVDRIRERLSPRSEYRLIMKSRLFDPGFYLKENPDVASAGMNPLEHFLRSGAKEGRKPSPLFDPQYYLSTYTDVAAAGMNPLVHFIRSGATEGRNPSAAFETSLYLKLYPDVEKTGLNP